jgi:hypothetical protein
MRGIVGVAIGVVIMLVLVFIVLPIFFPAPAPLPTDTTTHSREVAGFYGRGDFTGELLQSDIIQTNLSEGNMSQSIQFKGAICQRLPGLGRVFLDGARATEPDAIYRVYVNGLQQYAHPMELGSSSALSNCLPLVQKDFILTGQSVGIVRVELVVYVYDVARGAGAYEVMAYDQAILQ